MRRPRLKISPLALVGAVVGGMVGAVLLACSVVRSWRALRGCFAARDFSAAQWRSRAAHAATVQERKAVLDAQQRESCWGRAAFWSRRGAAGPLLSARAAGAPGTRADVLLRLASQQRMAVLAAHS